MRLGCACLGVHFATYDELKPGQGAIVRKGLRKATAYRDEKGKLFLRSAACSHLGCHLHWNSFERCWDCPCRGSQFARLTGLHFRR
jgi:Rieske Fe-S protein